MGRRADSIRKRISSVIVSALLLALLLSALFIVLHADHECTGDGCEICALIHLCERSMRALSYALVLLACLYAVLLLPGSYTRQPAFSKGRISLILLKVRLND